MFWHLKVEQPYWIWIVGTGKAMLHGAHGNFSAGIVPEA